MFKLRKLLMDSAESTAASSGATSSTPSEPAAPGIEGAPPAPSDSGSTVNADSGKSVEGVGEDWSELSAPEDATALGGGQPAAKPAVAPKPAAPTAPAAATPAAPAPAAATPAAPAATSAAPAAVPAAAPAPEAPETPEAKAAREAKEAEDFKVQETKLFDGLVEYYKLPDDMAEKLTTEPENVLPHMAAKVHQAVAKGVQRYIDQYLPAMIQTHMAHAGKEQAAKAAFYKAWPKLEGHEEAVFRAAAVYAQLHPNATPEQRIQGIGRLASEVAGVAIEAPAAAPSSAPSPAPVPAFRPAGAGGTSAVAAAPSAPTNEFSDITRDDD